MKMKMANSIAQTLRKYDTEYFFLMSGADPDLYAAVHDAEIRWVLCRSEKAAVYMADGYARISYKPGFVYGWCGPGAANVAAGIFRSRFGDLLL